MELQPRISGGVDFWSLLWSIPMGKHVQNKYPSQNGRDNRTYQLKTNGVTTTDVWDKVTTCSFPRGVDFWSLLWSISHGKTCTK